MIPYAPSTPYQRNATVADLMMQAGNQQAQAQLQKGAVWGRALGNIGDIASGAILDYQAGKAKQAEAQATNRRDQAFMSLLDQTGGNPDPKEVYRIFGPDKAPKIVEGLASFQGMAQKKGQEAAQHLPGLIRGMDAMSEETRASIYPSIVAQAEQSGAVPPGFAPKDYTPDNWKMIKATVLPPDTVKTREIKTRGADGSEKIQIVEDKPGFEATSAPEPKKPDTRSLEVRLAEALSSGDTAAALTLKSAIAQAAAAGRAPKEAPEPVDVSGDVRTTLSGRQYVDLGDYQTPTEKAKAQAAAKKAGVTVVSKEQGASLAAADTAKQNINAMWAQIESKLPKDAQGRLIAGPANKLSQFFQNDADLSAFNSWRAGAIQAVQALVERGMGFRLNQAEINLIMQNDMPQVTDTVDVAKRRIDNVLTLLQNKENSILTRDRSSLSPGAKPGPQKIGKYTVEVEH